MEEYYAQQYAGRYPSSGHTNDSDNNQGGQDSKQQHPAQQQQQISNGFSPAHMFGSPMDHGGTPQDREFKSQSRQGSNGQVGDSLNQTMMNFGPATGGEGSLDGFQFTPSGSTSGNMMMGNNGMFRNNSAANAAAAIIAQQQQRNQQMNMMNQYITPPSPYDMGMSPNAAYSQFFTHNGPVNLTNMTMNGQYMQPSMNMPNIDFSDPNNTAMFNAAAQNYSMMQQQQQSFDQAMGDEQSNRNNQNPPPQISRHTSHTSNMSQDHRGSMANMQQQSSNQQQQAQQSQRPQQSFQQQQQQQIIMQIQMQQQQQQSQQQQGQRQQVQRQKSTSTPQSLNRQNSMRGSQHDQASPHANMDNTAPVLRKVREGPSTGPEQQQHMQMKQETRRQSDSSQQRPGQVAQQQQDRHMSDSSQQRYEQRLQQEKQQPTAQQRQQNQSSDPARLAEAQQQFAKAQQKLEEAQGFPQKMALRPNMFKNAYSSTGFDMMNVLMRVATRRNPEINIGAVDLSCAFVVCDAEEHDCPIVYCSENFERLTGYTKHEILGRNCRFLQAPNGRVHGGVKRSYVDDDSVLYLREAVNAQKEAQVSMINYRKGGQPFMNLLTIIPIANDDDRIKWFVGFQVDLVEQPGSVMDKNSDGTYAVNYQRGLNMPRYVFEEQPQRQSNSNDSGQSVPREEVSSVLSAIATGESDLSRRLWDKVLLENTDDVVFVLSLKGLFLYLSPSSKRVLEYDALELMGTALSSVCHPSDIVPVTRELKDSTASQAVDVVFRIRRKNSGYMWFEGNGALHTEQGKGRKSIVLVGRERPVYALSKKDIHDSGGINDNELWTKLSTSGMFLFVSNAVRQLLDKTPDELVGTTMTALMRPETKREFLRILELARTGKNASTKHEMINKRGQVLQAFSTVYPGDAPEGKKPTFLIVQTRLLKYTKGTTIAAQRAIGMPEIKREASGTGPSSNASGSPMPTSSTTNPKDNHPANPARNNLTRNDSLVAPDSFTSTPGVAATIAGVHGLELGRQDVALASELNLFTELKTTRSTSWQFELRQMEKQNRLLAEELQTLLAAKKKRKRRKGAGSVEKECANCRTKTTPEWRRGPSGNRDLCNSCGLRFAKQQGRISPRTTTSQRSAHSAGSGGGNKRNSNGTPLNEANNLSPDEGEKGIDTILAETTTQEVDVSDQHRDKSNKNQATMRRFSSGGSLATQMEEDEGEGDAEGERDSAE